MENVFQWLLLALVGGLALGLCRVVSSLQRKVSRLQGQLAIQEAGAAAPPMNAAMRLALNVHAQMNAGYYATILTAFESALEDAGYCLDRDREKEAMLPWHVETKVGEAISRAQLQYTRPNLSGDKVDELVQRDAVEGYGRAWLDHMVTVLRGEGRYVARTAGPIDRALLEAA